MHIVDYQLGLNPVESWSNGDGAAALAACNTKCTVAHPFNSTKRDACKAGCTATHAAKQDAPTGTGQLVACNVKCAGLHPFNYTRREACKAGCAAQFEIRNPVPEVPIQTVVTEPIFKETFTETFQRGTIAANPYKDLIPPTQTTQNAPLATPEGQQADNAEASAGMGNGTKIIIGVSILAVAVLGFLILRRR